MKSEQKFELEFVQDDGCTQMIDTEQFYYKSVIKQRSSYQRRAAFTVRYVILTIRPIPTPHIDDPRTHTVPSYKREHRKAIRACQIDKLNQPEVFSVVLRSIVIMQNT